MIVTIVQQQYFEISKSIVFKNQIQFLLHIMETIFATFFTLFIFISLENNILTHDYHLYSISTFCFLCFFHSSSTNAGTRKCTSWTWTSVPVPPFLPHSSFNHKDTVTRRFVCSIESWEFH